MSDFATINDVRALWRSNLTTAEEGRVTALLSVVSAELRAKARQRGRDLDEMIMNDPDIGIIAKSVVVDIVRRYINDNESNGPSMTQATESALGYSVSGTYLVPGGGLFIKESELKRLGLKRQRFGVIDLC